MKKIFLFIQLAALTGALPAFALVGGPFDNGDYSVLNERSGYYQATYTFNNGNGYSLWTPDNSIGITATSGQTTVNLNSASLITPNNATSITHNANRTVLYYKGVVYIGSAFGSVDFEQRSIQGYGNAASEYTTTTGTTSGAAGFGTGTSMSPTSVIQSGRSYVANVNWVGDITDTAPQLRFEGTGELVVLAPNGQETLAGLAYDGYAGLIDAIVASVSSLTTGAGAGGNVGLGDAYSEAQTAIEAALQALIPHIAGSGPTNNLNEAEVQRLEVEGYRRFF